MVGIKHYSPYHIVPRLVDWMRRPAIIMVLGVACSLRCEWRGFPLAVYPSRYGSVALAVYADRNMITKPIAPPLGMVAEAEESRGSDVARDSI